MSSESWMKNTIASSGSSRIDYLGGHIVGDAELQMVDDALHGVVGLLPCGPEVFLHGTCQGRKDGLSRLPGVHRLPQVFRRGCGLVDVVPLDVGEGFLYCHHQSGRRYRGW